eukprot:8229656-Lingulodinium_polyedra.AAC.1
MVSLAAYGCVTSAFSATTPPVCNGSSWARTSPCAVRNSTSTSGLPGSEASRSVLESDAVGVGGKGAGPAAGPPPALPALMPGRGCTARAAQHC